MCTPHRATQQRCRAGRLWCYAAIPSGWIPSRPQEGRPFHQAFHRIQLQKRNGGAAFRCHTSDVLPIEPKMLCPPLRPGIEEGHQRARRWIEGTDITPFPPIAHGARQGEVLQHCLAAMFFRNHMIDLMRRGHQLLGQQAIFTAVVRLRDDLAADINGGPRRHGPSFCSTRAFSSRTTCSKRS